MPTSFYHPKNASLLLMLAALVILGIVYVMQYGFGMAPCQMCIWQRWPFGILTVVGLIGAFTWPRTMLILALLVMLASIGLAGYHVGVEQGVVPLPAGCATVGEASSVEELKAMLKAAPPTCDQVSFTLLGLSLAGWNVVGSVGLALFITIVLIAGRRRTARMAHQS